MKHTQGEWKVIRNNQVCFSDRGRIKDCDLYPLQYDNIEEVYANAKLITAAPELLEFAKAFSKLLANGEMDIEAKDGYYKEVADMVGLNINAIQKATL
jgi:hypothetical protein